MDAQLTATKGPSARGESLCMACASNSLPVPLGPMMSTLEWWAATNSIERRTWSDHGDTPTIR